MKPYDHPAYNASLQHAARRAYEAREESTSKDGYYPPCFKVWFVQNEEFGRGDAMYVRTAEAAAPKGEKVELVCIAQVFSRGKHADGRPLTTVQLRFDGARSEWVNF